MLATIIAPTGATVSFAQVAEVKPPPQQSLPVDDPFQGFSTNLDISTEESKAKTEFSYSGYFAPRQSKSGDMARRNDLTWRLGLSIPIGGKSDVLEKGTLDNLGDGTKFSAGITLVSFTSNPTATDNPDFLALMDQARAQCARNAGVDQAKVDACVKLRPDEDVIREHTPWLTLQMNRAIYGSFWTIGSEGSVSVANYSYLETPSLNEKKDRRLGYSGKISFNNYFADAVSKFKAELEYSDAPQKADSAIICKPVVTIPADDCKSGASVRAERKEALVIRGGYARYLPFKTGKAGIGMEITGSKDILSKDWAVEMPIYFTIPGIAQISPGVKPSYGAEKGEKDFTVSLFMKTAFSF